MPEAAPARKRVRLEYDERRRQILAAARRLFCQRPYSEVSMADLAEAAGVARGLLHHYFASKRELYLEVIRQIIQVPLIPLPTPGESVERSQLWDVSVESFLHLIDANRELWLTVIGTGAGGRDPELQEILDTGKEHTAGRAIEALGVDPADAPPELWALVRGFGGFTEEVTREWLERGRIDRGQAREALRLGLPLLVDQVLPRMIEAGTAARSKRTAAVS